MDQKDSWQNYICEQDKFETKNSMGHKFTKIKYEGYLVCVCGLHENQEGMQFPCKVDYQRLEAQLAEALAMLKEANHAVAEDDAEIQGLEAQIESVKEYARLAAESYDANARGWQEDIKRLEGEIERLRGVLSEVTADTVYSDNEKLREENSRLSYELSKVVGLAPAALIEDGKISVKCERCERLENLLFASGAMFEPPCFCCGYNGDGYFNSKFHICALRHHALAKQALEVPRE